MADSNIEITAKIAIAIAETFRITSPLNTGCPESVEFLRKKLEDNVMGKLDAERFAKLSEGYEQEQADLKQSVENLRAIVNAAEPQAVNIQSFLKIVKKHTEPTELTPAILREFVKKVVVHAPDKPSGYRVQRIDALYVYWGDRLVPGVQQV